MTTTYPLGRNTRHDPRSLAYKVQAAGDVASADWARRIPVLDQGQLGSCTGNAATGLLGTEPYASLWTSTFLTGLDEAYAVGLYAAATVVDGAPGTYPPHDTGSDGLAVAQVLKARGLTPGYTHVTSLAAAHTAVQAGPFITGTGWYASMFQPDGEGIVTPGGRLEGGHEYEVLGYDAARGLWHAVNSWGLSWGPKGGHFYFSDATYARLLHEDGDATVITPLGQPAPQPTPQPAPVGPVAVLDAWAAARHTGAAARAAAAWVQVRPRVS